MADLKPALLTPDQALALLLQAAQHVGVPQSVATLEANGRVLAADQYAQIDVPGADNSQMDGYAVRLDDCVVDAQLSRDGSIRLPVSQRIAAGQPGVALAPGSAARIFTGALIPAGADAVVMQEECMVDGAQVTIAALPQRGAWIRRRGEDIESGSMILAAGTRLSAPHLGLAASVGLAQLPVWPRVRVAMFFTGDELIMPGQPLVAGAIYNSNRFLLRALLENLGCDISDHGIVPDQLDATRAMLRQAAMHSDLVLTCGGVSVGEEDHVKPAVTAEGQLTMWQIAIKPGKPLAFGNIRRTIRSTAHNDAAFFIGLPGNPVSTFVTFLLLVRPFILRLQGVQDVAPKRYAMRADFAWPKADRRNEFLRARINLAGGLDLFPHQGSGVLTSTVWGDGLIDNPPGHPIADGDMVWFLPFAGLL